MYTQLLDIGNLFSDLMFGSSIIMAPFWILYVVGLWKVVEKSNMKGWFAVPPIFRDYKLACLTGRESDGRVLAILDIWEFVFLLLFWTVTDFFSILSEESVFAILLSLTNYAVIFMQWVYRIRIFNGLIELYGLKRRWMALMLVSVTRWLPMLILGFSKKYKPQYSEEDLHEAAIKTYSEKDVVVMEKGLTVNLKKREVTDLFKKKTLLKDIHLYIQPGHMVMLLGGSGSGKTTFLNAVNGYEKADANMVLDGKDIYKQYRKMLYEVGFVPQTDLMRGKDTVYHTLDDNALLRLPRNINTNDRKERVDSVLETFGLTRAKDNLVEKMSGGQKKRLSIAMEYINNPSLFILDEPDSGLDGVMARSLMTHLRSIADQGKIVIVITHTPDRVADLFDDVIVLARDSAKTGRLAYYGPIEDSYKFFNAKTMEEIVLTVNSKDEGGKGLADDYIKTFGEVSNG